MNKNIKDLTGQVFGRLTVIEYDSSIKSNQCAYWKVLCVCGNTKSVRRTSLTSGRTISCGCYNKERIVEAHTLPNNQSILNKHFRSYIHGAKRRNYTFDLSFDQFVELVKQNCHYCGMAANNNRRSNTNTKIKFNGIDRIDNTQGYTIENSITCCGKCNRAKDTMTYFEYLKWIELSYKHQSENELSLLARMLW